MGRNVFILLIITSISFFGNPHVNTLGNKNKPTQKSENLDKNSSRDSKDSYILQEKQFKEKGDAAARQGDVDFAHICWEKSNYYRSKAYPAGNYHLAWNTTLLAYYHHLKKNYTKSFAYADKTVELISGLTIGQQKELEIYKIWNILGQTYKQDKEALTFKETQAVYKRVIAYYISSAEFIKANNLSNSELAGTYRLLGNSYTDLVPHAIKEDKSIGLDYYNKATHYYEKSIDLSKKLIDDELYQLSKTYFVQGLMNFYVEDRLEINTSERSIHFYELAVEAYGIDIAAPINTDLEKIESKSSFLMLLKYLTIAYFIEYGKDESPTWLEKAEKINRIAMDSWGIIHKQYLSNNINQSLSIYSLVPFIETISIELLKHQSNLEYNLETIFKANQKLKYYDLLKLDKSNTVVSSDISIQQLQSKLKDNEIFLDFHVSREAKQVIALRFTPTTAQLITLPFTDKRSFENTIGEFLKAIKPFNFNQYTKSAYGIYESFLKPCNIGNSDLILCLDGDLNILPFEALLTSKLKWEKKDYRKLDYLIQQNKTQYVLNPQLFRVGQNDSEKVKQLSLQVFIPKNENFSALPFSQTLGENLEINSKAQLFALDMATKNSFFNFNSSIVHLSGHGVISDQNALENYLVFSDSLLYLNELIKIKNIPALMVLNTCNSAVGQIYSGDGINGFVRTLSRMGTSSVLSNLWEVDDQASNALLIDFYASLNKGFTTSESLNKAQLEIIQNGRTSKSAAPYYWAAHRLMGEVISFDKSETNQSSKFSKLWFITISVLLILLGVSGKYFYNKIKKSTSHRN